MKNKIKKWLQTKPRWNANKLAKNEQLKHAAVLLSIGVACYGFYCYSSANKHQSVVQEEASFDGVFESTFNQSSDEALLLQQQKQIDSLKESVALNEKKQKTTTAPEPDSETKALVLAMQEQLAQLAEENKKTNEKLQVALLSNREASLVTVRPPTREEIEAQHQKRHQIERDMLSKSGLETVEFSHRRQRNKETRTARNYVWAGTFVEGVLLTGILGDAGINGSKNQGTAVIRLTSGGIMPNNQRSHLEDCTAIVSTYGDLSGSAVVLHLETLSCAGSAVNFEQRVYGSVFDLDAMQDLRGTSVLKTKPLLSYSAAAGMLAGFGDGLKNLNTAQTINPGAGTITTYGQAQALGQSAAGGALSNPANRISDYVMRIADIYHPLVVTKAGRRVSVLFTAGFWIDKEHQVYESARAINEREEANKNGLRRTITGAYEPQPLTMQEGAPSVATDEAPSMNDAQQLEQRFLSQQGQVSSPLFSNIQK